MEKKTFVQFIKFVVIGVLNTGVDWIVFFLLRFLPFFQTAETFAKGISFVVAATNSFIWNSLWTFRQEFKEGMAGTESKIVRGSSYYIKFMAVSTVGLFLNILVFNLARNYLFKGDNNWMRLLALALASFVVIVWNFSVNKWWTYKS